MLEKIVARKKEDLKFFQLPRREEASPYSLKQSLAFASNRDGIGLIAEIKRASPSKGVLAEDLDVVKRAKAYEAGGADAISVLTDGPYFQGSITDLIAVKQAVNVPVLRKDFIVDERQIEESARIGADAILLIASVLEPDHLKDMAEMAHAVGLETLVEVHTEDELKRLLDVYAPPLLGINNRNLQTFATDTEQTRALSSSVPEGTFIVSESGIHSPEDVAAVAKAGAKAMLIGERLVSDGDPEKTIPDLKKGALLE
ncbi:indole-3-glycerol phosphate synthase TrpC [Salicibibacter halophilus]|uniref:Indole-3-glycerol phosphate synthase n=1 Tax=Salicibibacter halophilus TaxID=2502791 RepID=A0A514LDN0_9BACI|nr:indole-3-glycerol phosphate synthase TrpC [Salicibibacter halophilus]QDI89959.1 indole-3-glycerol phosphate synthase TrpC [Salicibibacter halophilus]